MTIEQEIEFWAQQLKSARTKHSTELALVCFGIKVGLEIARSAYLSRAKGGG